MLLANSISFDPADVRAGLAGLPEAQGVFALRPAGDRAEPYLGKTPNLRRRLMRLLRGPAETLAATAGPAPRRLQLAHLVRHIEYSVTGSEFESLLCLYQASLAAFGDGGRRRLRLRPPAFLRMALENPYPRISVTTRISPAAASALFGPFPSRAAAERYAEEMLNFFLLRRCHGNLNPDPAFPGCVYSEMKMCLAPCFRGCSEERYRQETGEVLAFLSTRGASLLARLDEERNAASEALEFERAAALHLRIQKTREVARMAGDAVRSLARLNGIVVQPAAAAGAVALFALRGGFLCGPALYSTAGMPHSNQQPGGGSLFAHPAAQETVSPVMPALQTSADCPRTRLEEALSQLEPVRPAAPSPRSRSSQILSDHLALFTRWFYQPAARRVGEVVFAAEDGLGSKPILRAISRVVRADSPPAREAAAPPATIPSRA